MVGRREEQAFLADLIDDAQRRGVLLSGRAGVGKSRLMREVLRATTSCHVELLTATESARPIPFGATARLLPEHLETVDQVDLLGVIERNVLRRAEGRPVLLAVDDAHLLDSFSAALVHYLVTAGATTALLTLRTGEPAPDAITALHRDGILERLELQAISRVEFNNLVEAALDGPTMDTTLDQLWSVTEGNVLFARELISDALDAGTLLSNHGVWRWSGALGDAPRLKETVAARLGALTAPERSLLDVLCIAEPLSITSAQRFVPGASVAGLERRGLVAVDTSRRRTELRLGHPLFGEVLRGSLPVALRRSIHHDVADHRTEFGLRRYGDRLEVALCREAAGEPADPALLASAARTANTLTDHVLAERLARSSGAEGGGFSAGLQLGQALLGQHRLAEAETVLAALVGSEPTDQDRAQLADALVLVVGYALGRVNDALAILCTAEEAVIEPAVKALLRAHRATLLAFGARFGEAAELGAAALASVDDESVRIRALTSVGISLVMAGQIDQALAMSEQAFEPALRLQDRMPRAPAWVVTMRTSALFLAGHADGARELMELALSTIPNGTSGIRSQANVYLGRLALAQGRPATAARLLNDAAVTIREYPVVPARWCLALAAEAHALLGQHEAARALVEELRSYAPTEIIAFEADEQRALAWVDAQCGRTSEAIAKLWCAADAAASRGQRAFEMLALHDLLRLAEHRAAERTLEVTSHVDGPWAAAISAHADAILGDDTARLHVAAESFEAIGCSLLAAELWAWVSAARKREALPARATEAARRSRALARQCEGATTEPLSWATARVPLSRRERETATLAADGNTNAQIATDLSVSVRTVESHLYAAFAKLGITHRDQLTDALLDA